MRIVEKSDPSLVPMQLQFILHILSFTVLSNLKSQDFVGKTWQCPEAASVNEIPEPKFKKKILLFE